jgi:parvulin-like peptidyl-prolyl isomerase
MRVRIWGLQILASTAVLAIFANGASAQSSAAPAKPVAIVDGTPITMTEVEAVLKQIGPSPTPLTESQKKQMHMEAIGMLIDDILMQQFLRKNGPQVDPSEVNKKLAELNESLKKQNKTLQEFMKESGQSETQLRGNVLNMLQWSVFVKQRLTDEDVKRYYDENKEYFDRIVVRASHIVFRVPATASDTERESTRAKLLGLRQEIEGGKIDFADAAKKYSQCASAPNGGDIGYFPRKMTVEEPFARAAFALKVGQLSEVVQTDYGLHLIKVTDRKPGQPSDFNKMKDEVREMCIEEMRMALLAHQRKTAHVEINLP